MRPTIWQAREDRARFSRSCSTKKVPDFRRALSWLNAEVEFELVWVRSKRNRKDFLLTLVVNPGFD